MSKTIVVFNKRIQFQFQYIDIRNHGYVIVIALFQVISFQFILFRNRNTNVNSTGLLFMFFPSIRCVHSFYLLIILKTPSNAFAKSHGIVEMIRFVRHSYKNN